MAIVINPFFRGSTSKGFTEALFQTVFATSLGQRTLRIYPSTVPYPGPVSIPSSYSLPTGSMLDYTNLFFSISGSSIILLSGTLAVNATTSGVPAWWALNWGSNPTASTGMVSDSISQTGSGAIVTLSSMSITTGQSVTVNFNLASL